MIYDPVLVQPMREELLRLGVQELVTTEEVDEALGPDSGTVLLVVNSVCGCAARNARPAVALAAQHPTRPDAMVTVFAGQDAAASARARADSSPSSRNAMRSNRSSRKATSTSPACSRRAPSTSSEVTGRPSAPP